MLEMVLFRLLQGLPRDAYVLISKHDFHDPEVLASAYVGGDYTAHLPGAYFKLPPERYVARKPRFWRARNLLNIVIGIIQRARNIRDIVRREGCDAVVVCSGGFDLLDLPAGYLASKLARVSCFPFLMDFYSYQWQAHNQWGKFPRLARWAERRIVRGSAGVIVLNDFMQRAIKERYGVDATIVRHPCDLADYPEPANQGASPDGARVVFTGAIYEAHFDAFRNLIESLKLLNGRNVTLHCYTAQSPDHLAKHGISGPVVVHPHQPLSAMAAIQQEADMLFLPLAFESPFPEIIKTSCPTKLSEYLASGRPILAHAPRDSFLAWYFREHQCGVIVDELDPRALATAMSRLMDDGALRASLGAAARRQAEKAHAIDAVQRDFLRAIGYAPAPSGKELAMSGDR